MSALTLLLILEGKGSDEDQEKKQLICFRVTLNLEHPS
jgi:hypothetical protein